MRHQPRFSLFLSMILALVISACVSNTPTVQPTSMGTAEGTLRMFPSETPTETPLPTGYVTTTPTPIITPTPTQVLYEVQLDDDMYAIAFYYGLEPQAIMTANPDVNPNAMTVGMQLVIPITPSPEPTVTPTTNASATETVVETETEATAAPQEFTLGEPACYPDATGGLWCFILAVNGTESARENVSALVTVSDDETTLQETAIMPLNLLPAGETLPLVTYFEGPLPALYSITAELDFYLPVMPEDDRYLSVAISDESVAFNTAGDIAYVSGSVSLGVDQGDAQYTWVSATALDAEGRIVAVRRWEATAPLTAGSEQAFSLTLYSYDGEIDRVLLLAEGQPVAEVGE